MFLPNSLHEMVAYVCQPLFWSGVAIVTARIQLRRIIASCALITQEPDHTVGPVPQVDSHLKVNMPIIIQKVHTKKLFLSSVLPLLAQTPHTQT